MKSIFIAIALVIPALASAQSNDGWSSSGDGSAAWGGRTDNLNPIAPQNIHKLDREQRNPLNDSVLPPPTVANPFDSNGNYIGESQVLTGAGVDPSTGLTTPDTPRQ